MAFKIDIPRYRLSSAERGKLYRLQLNEHASFQFRKYAHLWLIESQYLPELA